MKPIANIKQGQPDPTALKYGHMDALPGKLELWFDGMCEPNPLGLACYGWAVKGGVDVLKFDKGVSANKGSDKATNNYAEYCGLGYGLAWLAGEEWTGTLAIYGDSKLVIEQVSGRWQCKAERLQALHRRCQALLSTLAKWQAEWIPRERNEFCDRLSRMAYDEHRND